MENPEFFLYWNRRDLVYQIVRYNNVHVTKIKGTLEFDNAVEAIKYFNDFLIKKGKK